MSVIYWYALLGIIKICVALQLSDCILENQKLSCRKNLPEDSVATESLTELQLFDFESEQLDFEEIFEKFEALQKISVFGGNISRLLAPKHQTRLKAITISATKLGSISPRFFENFTQLVLLDLRGNQLTKFDEVASLDKLENVYISDNKWNCSEDLDWVLQLNRNIVKDLDELICYGKPHPGKPLLSIAQFTKEMKDTCTEHCECSLPKVVRTPDSGTLEPIVKVNCSHRNISEIPAKFPEKTKILHLEGNGIQNLKPLLENSVFRNILDLYLDDNAITSIEELEGSYWFTHFRVLSLRNNKLAELPTYALDNALQQNPNMPNAVRITLSGNPWKCDCAFTPIFQEMLQKYTAQVADVNDVKCSYIEGDENSLLPILGLSRTSVCSLPTEYSIQEALDLLNAILGFLIVFVLAKLAYDYYHFKKTGRLPWIITKLP